MTSTSASLLAGASPQWERIVTHRFVTATADGSLPADAFDRWVLADHHFVVAFRRFMGQLVAIAPDEAARDLLASSFVPLRAELDLFREWAASHALDLDARADAVTVGYNAFLLAAPFDGWPSAITALFGAEKAYFDAWSAVRARADESSPYWGFVDNWSSPAFGSWVDDVAALLDRTVPSVTPHVEQVFSTVVALEVAFWDAVLG